MLPAPRLRRFVPTGRELAGYVWRSGYPVRYRPLRLARWPVRQPHHVIGHGFGIRAGV